MDTSWKSSRPIFFSCPSCLPFWSYAPLKKNQNGILLARYLEKYLSRGLNLSQLTEVGHFKIVSKISRKLFKLGAWNLASWIGLMSRLPDYNFSTNSTRYFWSYGPLPIWAFQTCQQENRVTEGRKTPPAFSSYIINCLFKINLFTLVNNISTI